MVNTAYFVDFDDFVDLFDFVDLDNFETISNYFALRRNGYDVGPGCKNSKLDSWAIHALAPVVVYWLRRQRNTLKVAGSILARCTI